MVSAAADSSELEPLDTPSDSELDEDDDDDELLDDEEELDTGTSRVRAQPSLVAFKRPCTAFLKTVRTGTIGAHTSWLDG